LQTNFPNTLSAVNTPTFGVWSQYDVFNNATLNSSNQLQGSMVAATSLKGQGVDFARGFIGLTDIETSPASAITHTSVEGITGRVYVGATTSNTTIGSATSLLADLWMLSSNVTVTSAYQLRISNAGLSAGTLTNYYGVYVGALGATSTTISSYNAMYVGDISNGAATKRAFFYDATSGTNKPFAILSSGNTGIGTSTPSQLLEVKDGNILLSRNSVASRQLQFQSSNGTGLSTFEAGGQANTTINYTLPTSAPSANQVLTATGIAGSVVTLSWAAAGAGSGWALTGNSGTTAGTNFVGTTDDQPLYLQVKNTGTATIYNSLQLGNSATSPSALYREKTASTTGNARGANSVDLQISRSAATQVASGSASVISGGTNNTVSGANSVIGGGSGNSISGGYSAIDGGGNLTLGDNSFGFNGTKTVGAPSTANLSGVNGIAYFGDVDLWLGNVNNSARQLRFYKGNSSSTYAGALYSSFEAGATQGATINYILPLSQPAAGNILQASTVSGAGPYTVQLAWTSNNTGWNTSGNTNTDTLATGANNFIGTTDIMPFEVRVNANAGSGGNGRVLRLEPNSVSPNIIAGYNQNTAIGTFTTGGAGRSVYGVGILSGGESGALMNNYVSDNYGVVVGGRANQAGDNAGTVSDKSFAVVGGGEKNTAAGQYSFIAGGSYLKLGDYSFGYNHATGTTQTDISTSSGTAYLGNVNLWIGNTDNSPRQLRFYAGNNANYTYPATVYYTSFAAGAQGANINYILPTAAPVASGNLLYSTTGGAMSWSSGMAWDFTNTRLGVNTASPNTKLDVNGDVAMRESAMTFANNNNNVNIGNVSFVTVTGPTANFTITGFQSGQNGKMLIVCNLTGFSMTVNHLDNNSNVSNRVICENGLNQTVGAVAGFGCMTFIYSTSANAGNGAWLLVSKN
jgi:hypothetical protein